LAFIRNGDESLLSLPYLEENRSHTVQAISNTEWIGGLGTGDEHEVLLVWIPEPATLSLLTLGSMALIRRRK